MNEAIHVPETLDLDEGSNCTLAFHLPTLSKCQGSYHGQITPPRQPARLSLDIPVHQLPKGRKLAIRKMKSRHPRREVRRDEVRILTLRECAHLTTNSSILIPSSRSREGRVRILMKPCHGPCTKMTRCRFMNEGKEYDDKWRMVEDEFLTIAKQFTIHLHAAEYKRQQKMVKSRNADTINSISRPVTGKMPDHTKRKMEAAVRTKTQRAALENVVVKKAEEEEDSDDGDGLPYFGTTLHGLMDSPRKKAASLAKPGTIAATTRAAAGFKYSAAQSRPERKHESPQSKVAIRTAKRTQPMDESSEDDDNLDAPIPAPKLTAIVKNTVTSSGAVVKSSTSIKTTKSLPEPQPSLLSTTKSNSFSTPDSGHMRTQLSPETKPRISRAEQARHYKAKLEKEQKAKGTLDVIPTFL